MRVTDITIGGGDWIVLTTPGDHLIEVLSAGPPMRAGALALWLAGLWLGRAQSGLPQLDCIGDNELPSS